MAQEPRPASSMREWAQTVFIGVGVVAGMWQFIFKEVWAPAGAPINLTMEVSAKQVGFRGSSNEQFEAIELAVSARNPSTPDVFLLSNCWYAEGIAVVAHKEGKADWASSVTKRIDDNEPSTGGLHYQWDKTRIVGGGEVFPTFGAVLHPMESIATSLVFYLPQDRYDLLRVWVQLPTTGVRNSSEVVWTMSADQGCQPQAYRKKPSGERGEQITDFLAAVNDRHLQLQAASSWRELSLWQQKSPGAEGARPPAALPR
jgi:hypothetical protein